MIYLFCFVGCILAYVCYMVARDARETGDTKTFRYIFVTNSLEFLIPCTAVALFYIVLGISLQGMEADEVTLATLRLYESRVLWVKETLKFFKLSAGYSFLLLAGCFLLTLAARYVASSDEHRRRINRSYEFFEKYNKVLKRVGVVVTLLASFTFFGGQSTSPPKRLEARIKHLVDEYNGYQGELQSAVSQSLANEVYVRLANSAAPSYRQFSKVEGDFRVKYETLTARYRTAKSDHNLVAPRAQALADTPPHKQVKLDELLPEGKRSGGKTPRVDAPPREQEKFISKQKLRGLKASVKEYSAQVARQTESVLSTPLGSRLAPSGLRTLLTHNNSQVLKALAQEYPILEALLPVFTETFNKKVGEGINDISVKLAHKAITSPSVSLEGEINTGVREILKATPVEWATTSGEAFAKSEASLQHQLLQVDAAKVELDALLKIKEAGLRSQNRQLLAQLRRDWEKAVRSYKPDTVQSWLDPSFKPARQIGRGAAKGAIDKFIAEAQQIPEPVKQNQVLRSSLDLLRAEQSFDYKVSELRSIAQYSLPGEGAAGELARLERSIQPKFKFTPPTTHHFPQMPNSTLHGMPGYKLPPTFKPPTIYKPPPRPVYKPPRIWIRR